MFLLEWLGYALYWFSTKVLKQKDEYQCKVHKAVNGLNEEFYVVELYHEVQGTNSFVKRVLASGECEYTWDLYGALQFSSLSEASAVGLRAVEMENQQALREQITLVDFD